MSRAERPETNPYAAPVSDLMFDDRDQAKPFLGYAGFWRRFGAFFIDQILVYIFTIIGAFIIGVCIGVVGAMSGNSEAVQTVGPIVGAIFGLSVFFFYYPLMESSKSQATLGKMALGIKVTDLDGRRISFGRAAGRMLGKILSILILYIGCIMAAFTERKQAMHDMMASTLVVKVR